ncbi:hypothetical protein INT47_001295 [Mucor saturninus]|uniref:Uncharacterized protein n=1 Tax=Mucor saturninus TaxID=64648 RepID=A0A8H7RN63_9FUNG|nr:hypothetical protein INT47_001295 [Mucor saturninus]
MKNKNEDDTTASSSKRNKDANIDSSDIPTLPTLSSTSFDNPAIGLFTSHTLNSQPLGHPPFDNIPVDNPPIDDPHLDDPNLGSFSST